MNFRISTLFFAALLVVSGCSKTKDENSGVDVSGEKSKAGTSLAYEHTVRVTLAEDLLSVRMQAVRNACDKAKFGDCSLLNFEQTTGDYARGSITVRVLPAGVEPLVGLAGEGGAIGSRETRAEDLAEVVFDTAQQQQRLELQRNKLLEFQARKELAVSDMLTIANELASVESQLLEAKRAKADQTRRIETNLLTINFSPDTKQSRLSSIANAFGNALDSAIEGMAEAIDMFAFGLPFLFIAFPVAVIWRWLWRRVTGRSAIKTTQ